MNRRELLRTALITAAVPLFVAVDKVSAAANAVGRALGAIDEDPAWEYYMGTCFPNGPYGKLDFSLPKYNEVRKLWGVVVYRQGDATWPSDSGYFGLRRQLED